MTPYDNMPPASPPGSGEPGSLHPRSWRSGSQKRRRNRIVKVCFTDEEYDAALSKAADARLSPSSYARALMIGTPGPRARRTPHIHAEVIARATAALNKIGNVVNQIAHVLNAGGALGMAQQYSATLAEIREAARAIREAVSWQNRDHDKQREQAQ